MSAATKPLPYRVLIPASPNATEGNQLLLTSLCHFYSSSTVSTTLSHVRVEPKSIIIQVSVQKSQLVLHDNIQLMW